MSTQAVVLARSTDPVTSHMAATAVNVSRYERAVIDTLKQSGPATSDRVAELSGINTNAITPRFRPLAIKGLIRDTGKKEATRTGRKAIVWGLTEAGSEY